MGAMNNLRENTGVILWILVISFGVIWTLQDSDVFNAIGQRPQNIAVVNGSPISYEKFQRSMKQQRQQVQQRYGGNITPQMEEMIRQRAYDQLVNQQLLQQKMDELGIAVTDSEIEQMVFGQNPHPIIRRQFADSTGQINYQLLRNIASNPESKAQWLRLEQVLRQQRRQQKMSSLVQATVHVSEADVKDYHRRQNAQASVDYVAQRYASVPNDSIQVTESDLRAYHENNKEDFKRDKTLSLQYATLSKVPTSQDTTAVMQDLQGLRSEFATAERDSTFLQRNASKRSYSAEYQTPNQMAAAVADSVFATPEPGRITGPVVDNDLAHLVKVRDVRPAEQTFVHARHILLETNEPDPSLSGRLQSIRDSIANGQASFEAMARRYSDDGSASQGGDLGWFGRGQMADAFENAAFSAEPGELVGPVKSEFGYHLIRVETRASQAAQVADLAYDLSPGQATLTDLETQLADLAYYAEESGSFTEEAKRLDLEVQEVQVEAGQTSVPGVGQSRALASFTESAEAGEISEVVELDDQFAVVHVGEVTPEGYRSFESVKSQIRPQVVLQRKRTILTNRMESALQRSGFRGLPTALGTQMRSKSDVTFATETIPGIGTDPSFAGTVFGLEEGQTSSVVEGENAAYVVRINQLQEPGALTQAERQKIRQQLMRQEQKQVSSQWIAALKEEATIEDNRGAFQ